MRLMMQALLNQRFGFAMHYEIHETAVYALEVAKSGKLGAQLRPHPTNATCVNQFSVNGAGQIAMDTDADGFPTVCGGIVGVPSRIPGTLAIGARNITMKLFAGSISELGQLGRPVLDQMGLTGTYDFWLEFTPQNNRTAVPQEVNAPGPDNAGPAIIEALKEQLGLKLESQKGQGQEIIVDRIDHPSAN
jgi:uncharacterized protein (TIGR03435 family)